MLDENFPRRLKFQLKEYETFTVRELAWDAFKNGLLLRMLVQENFDKCDEPVVLLHR